MGKGSARRPRAISAEQEEAQYRKVFNAPSDFHRFCGPAVIASVLGVSRRAAAGLILAYRNFDPPNARDLADYRKGYTGDDELLAVLWKQGRAAKGWQKPRRRVTFAKWLAARQATGDALVIVAEHVIHVRGRTVVEDDGLPSLGDYVAKWLTVSAGS